MFVTRDKAFVSEIEEYKVYLEFEQAGQSRYFKD